AKFDPTGVVIYSTYLGGSDTDAGLGIAADASGNVYVTGQTKSLDFPTTAGAFQGPNAWTGTFGDAFVSKLDTTGCLVYSTYRGGVGADFGTGVAADGSGRAVVTGYTSSGDFPTTATAFADSSGGYTDAFVTKLNPAGSAPIYSTYLGGSVNDQGN